eukprot:SAG11_NODE_291_length_11180_cov_102.040155_16_plen_398_part_00
MMGDQPDHADDNAHWMQPPAVLTTGQPIWVDFRIVLKKISAVDTVTGTAFIDITFYFHWTDSRLADWPEDAELPPRLWGPNFRLANSLGDMQELDVGFALDDLSTGRLKRERRFFGTVDNPMDLRDFPFDMDRIEMKFFTCSDWLTYNGERGGNISTKGRSYRLRQVQKPGEGKWLQSLSFQIGEWELHGISTKIYEAPTHETGFEDTFVPISCHVTRKSGYYFWKCLMPIHLLTVLSMSTFHFETDNLSDRVSTVTTIFLAAFAMLYVVGAALPKTDFLTKIDVVIVLTTLSLAFIGVASLALAKVHKDSGVDVADKWNLIIEIALILCYFLANLWIFLPPCLRQLSAAARLTGYKRLASAESDVQVAGDLPPTVQKGSDYYILKDLILANFLNPN